MYEDNTFIFLEAHLMNALPLSTLGEISSRRHIELFFYLFFPESRSRNFMQIVSYEMSSPFLCVCVCVCVCGGGGGGMGAWKLEKKIVC